jgi:hypothetical protein
MADDPNRHIPKPPQQVIDQIAAVDRMMAEALKPAEGGPETPPPPPAAAAPPAPQASQQPPPFDPRSPTPAAASPAQPAGADGGDEQTWERRHKSLQGRYDSMAANYQQQQSRLSNLETVLATLQAAGSTPPPAPSPAELRAEKLLTDAEVDEYGQEMLDVVGKRSTSSSGSWRAASTVRRRCCRRTRSPSSTVISALRCPTGRR